MDYYINANEQLEGAEVLAASEKYRLSITLLCLSGELFIKSLVEKKDPMNPLLDSHDIVGLGHLIRSDVDYQTLAPKLSFMRKYLNDSRYPYDTKIYTKKFYEEFLGYVQSIKEEVDRANEKKYDVERLSEKFGKDKVKDKKKKH